MNETNMSETTVGITEMAVNTIYLINEIPRKLIYIDKDEPVGNKHAPITLTFRGKKGDLVFKHSSNDKDKYKVYNKNEIDSNIDESASDSVDTDKVGIHKMEIKKTYLINEIPRGLEKIVETNGHLTLHFIKNHPIIRHNTSDTDKYKVVNTREIDKSPQSPTQLISVTNPGILQTNNSNTTESVPESVVNNTNTPNELEPTLNEEEIEEIEKLAQTATSAQIQQSKTLEDKIREYLTSLLNCINTNSEIKTKLIVQSFRENQDLFKYTDRFKFTNALRHMYTLRGNTKNDDLLDDILKSITGVISNDNKDKIIYTRHSKYWKPTKYTQHSGWGIRNYYRIPLPKPNLTGVFIELPIFVIYSPLSYTGRKLSQVKLSQVFDWREEYFTQLQKTVKNTFVNGCNIVSTSGGKRRQIKSKRKIRKTVRRRTTRSYRKK